MDSRAFLNEDVGLARSTIEEDVHQRAPRERPPTRVTERAERDGSDGTAIELWGPTRLWSAVEEEYLKGAHARCLIQPCLVEKTPSRHWRSIWLRRCVLLCFPALAGAVQLLALRAHRVVPGRSPVTDVGHGLEGKPDLEERVVRSFLPTPSLELATLRNPPLPTELTRTEKSTTIRCLRPTSSPYWLF